MCDAKRVLPTAVLLLLLSSPPPSLLLLRCLCCCRPCCVCCCRCRRAATSASAARAAATHRPLDCRWVLQNVAALAGAPEHVKHIHPMLQRVVHARRCKDMSRRPVTASGMQLVSAVARVSAAWCCSSCARSAAATARQQAATAAAAAACCLCREKILLPGTAASRLACAVPLPQLLPDGISVVLLHAAERARLLVAGVRRHRERAAAPDLG